MSTHNLYKWVNAVRPDDSETRSNELVETKSEILKLCTQLHRTEEGSTPLNQ